MKVSVVIPVRDRRENVNLVLANLSRQTLPKEDFEVIVSDYDSKDNLYEIISEWRGVFNFKYIFTNVKNGSWNASIVRNLGAFSSSYDTELIVFNDSDILLPKNALELYWEDYQANKNRIIIGSYSWMKRNNWTQQQIASNEDMRTLCQPYVESEDIRKPSFDKATSPNDVFTQVFDGLACFGGNLGVPKRIFSDVPFDNNVTIGLEDGSFGLSLWEYMKAGKMEGFSYDRRLHGYHMWHEKPADRFPPDFKEHIDRLNLRHFGTIEPDYGLIEASADTYRQWGVPSWRPPAEWRMSEKN